MYSRSPYFDLTSDSYLDKRFRVSLDPSDPVDRTCTEVGHSGELFEASVLLGNERDYCPRSVVSFETGESGDRVFRVIHLRAPSYIQNIARNIHFKPYNRMRRAPKNSRRKIMVSKLS
jgi:hypothetical protein